MAYIELEDSTSPEKIRLDNINKVWETTGIFNKMNVYLNANCYYSFYNMQNLISIPSFLNFNKIDNMAVMFMYDYALSLNISNISASNVTGMYRTFFNCHNIVGQPFCGPKVTDLRETYIRCYSLTGSPVCGSNVTNMEQAYFECTKLTGNAVCGPNVTNMYQAYYNCFNLTGAHFGKSIIWSTANQAYYHCNNIQTINVDCANAYLIGSTSQGRPFYDTSLSNVTNIIFGLNCTEATQTFDSGTTLTNTVIISGGENIINMAYTFRSCYYLKANPICGPKVINLRYTYQECRNIFGSPVCGLNVVDFGGAYYNCQNLTGFPACGNKVTDMSYAYYNCYNLNGPAICPSSVTNLQFTYANCYNINTAVFGRGINNYQMANNAYAYCNNIRSIYIDMLNAYGIGSGSGTYKPFNNANLSKVTNITFSDYCTNAVEAFYAQHSLTNTVTIIMGNNVTNMKGTFDGCIEMKGHPVCGPNVNNMFQAYSQCENMTGSPVAGPKVISMYYAYYNCKNLTGSAVCPSTVTNLQQGYINCYNINAAVFGKGLVNQQVADNAYSYCNNIKSIYVDMPNAYLVIAGSGSYLPFNKTNLSKVTNITFGPNCTTMFRTCFYQSTLTNTVVVTVGDNVTNMRAAFDTCTQMKGHPVCGPNVTDMYQTYSQCENLTGSPVCGPKVTNMYYAYYNCKNLTGSPVCGANVTDLYFAYANCYNLAGNIIVSPLVANLNNAFFNCQKISTIVIPNATKSIAAAQLRNMCNRCGYTTTRLNIIIENKTTYTTFRSSGATCADCTFTADAAHVETITVDGQSYITTNYAYNAAKNIYLYCLT